MGLTERHLFENEDVPENNEWALEDAVYNSCINKKHDDDIEKRNRSMDDYLECIVKFQYGIEVGCREELVRCKDCKHWNKEYDQNCMIKQGWFPVKPDWFCADGERKEGQ